jgi:hypothetical protein
LARASSRIDKEPVMAAVLEAISPQHKKQCTENVLSALLSPAERQKERFARHPIATLPTVCGCRG